ncbi:hypothetical protein L6R53_13550 [Myxococcota bacterium]|nr:hypothetical protein [Myxococcota bacterium]
MSDPAWQRPLRDEERAWIEERRRYCFVIYEGRLTPHRSCGVALAETFGLPTPSYQSLRRGGITGRGECGSLVAGRLVLGELLGDPDPTGPVTPALRQAMEDYDRQWPQALRRGAVTDSVVCNDLTGQFPAFTAPERLSFCTLLASDVAALVAEILVRRGHRLPPAPGDPSPAGPG